jgi:cysteinyl-tRNA synthetase
VAVEAHKKHPADFVLWKESSSTEPGWTGHFVERGETLSIYGRPGWHIECSAMSHRYLGETFDIHGGGIDLVFPHHENEIAQSCCAFGTPRMANVWMHNGFLQVEGQKMSKSLGNFVTINELLATNKFGGRSWPGEVLRLAMLKTHYRQPIDFTVKALEEASNELRYWSAKVLNAIPERGKLLPEFVDALSNDLNSHLALTVLRNRSINHHDLARALVWLGLIKDSEFDKNRLQRDERIAEIGVVVREALQDEKVNQLIEARLDARRNKNFAESDRIRDELLGIGIQLKDGKDDQGNPVTTWEVKR